MASDEDPDDRRLVERFLRARDEGSFRTVYRRHSPALYGLALRLLGHRSADAEDAVQEAWIRAVERVDRFRWESTLRTWLSSIVVNCCRERLRHEWRWVLEADSGLPRGSAEAPLELTLDVDHAIAKLPAGCRGVFVLHDVEGHTHEEIAALLDIAQGTSKSQLFHARRQLRVLLR